MKKIVRTMLASLALAAMVLAPAVLTGATAEAAGCRNWANVPYAAGASVYGKYGRSDCTSATTVSGELTHYLPYWSDQVVARGSFYQSTGSRTLSAAGHSGWDYYTRAIGSPYGYKSGLFRFGSN